MPIPVALMVASRYALPGNSDQHGLDSKPSLASGRSFVSGYSGVCPELKISRAVVESRQFDGVLCDVS